ncbi:MAG TPA: sigma-70 family RNA polymerase sigma factor [Anaerolineaceae bacterium]
MTANEAVWLKQALQGNEDAFAQLVETYQTPVYNLCYRMLGDELEAEDAAQEAFWRAYQGLKKYDPSRSFITWLLSIAAHYCIDQHRRRKLPTFSLDVLPEEDVPDYNVPEPEKVFGQRESERHVHALLNQLQPQDRAAIILRYWYDFSEEEISQTLNLTVSAVKSRLHRARRSLAEAWNITNPPQITSPERRSYESPII